ncbi:MAG: Lrp/AsnC family transcriptional regulator [Propionibacteriales bacterium]|nr:Lrp/AsnC family transcriptional regulator [Propionibacteriales bacterium]
MPSITLPLDDLDICLLNALQDDADRPLHVLGEIVGLSTSAVQRRVQKYKAAGLLRTVALIAPEKASRMVQALVLLTLAEESLDHHDRLSARLANHPAVQQCFLLSGRWDYAVIVTAGSVPQLRDLGNQLFKADDNIRRYDTMFLLDAVKSGQIVPAELLV